MTSALRIEALRKSRGDFHLGPLDIDVAPGQSLAIVGATGAGKTTTMNCVLGLQRPDGGRVSVAGEAARPEAGAWRREVGFVLAEQGFYERLSVAENLAFLASFYPRWDRDVERRNCARLALDPKKKVKSLSTGERKKLALVGATSHRPSLLLLDEPTSGLDPVARAEALELLGELTRSGDSAMLLATHIISDVSVACDDIAFLHGGRLVARSSIDELRDTWGRITYRVAAAPSALPGQISAEEAGSLKLVTSRNLPATRDALRRAGAEIFDETRLSLDDIVVSVIKGASRDS